MRQDGAEAAMNRGYFEKERDFFKTELLDDIIPFWLKYARDDECGGYLTCLRRDGSVYDFDKVSTWAMGRPNPAHTASIRGGFAL